MRMALRGSALLGVLAAAAFAAISTPAMAGNFSFTVVTPGLAVSAGQSGVALGVAQPGFYGVVSLGDLAAPPPVIYAEPVIIDAGPGDDGPPIYLHVPPGYERHWAEHCAVYRACGRPVYFVRDDWYRNVYVPRYRAAYVREHEREREHERDRYREREDSRRDYRDYRDHRDFRGRDDRGYDRGPRRDGRDRGRGDGRDHGDH